MFFSKKEKENNSVSALIVGLGNPGMTYERTRHNAGFMAVDYYCKKHDVDGFRIKFHAEIAEFNQNGNKVLIAKPQTFMNLSGNAVGEICRFYKIPPESVIVLFDDISFETGHMRIRKKGSAGGHNGIKSIIEQLSSENFPRIKIGIGLKPSDDYDLKDFVLSKFSKEDTEKLSEAFEKAAKAVDLMLDGRTDEAMNKYNG